MASRPDQCLVTFLPDVPSLGHCRRWVSADPHKERGAGVWCSSQPAAAVAYGSIFKEWKDWEFCNTEKLKWGCFDWWCFSFVSQFRRRRSCMLSWSTLWPSSLVQRWLSSSTTARSHCRSRPRSSGSCISLLISTALWLFFSSLISASRYKLHSSFNLLDPKHRWNIQEKAGFNSKRWSYDFSVSLWMTWRHWCCS